MAIGYIRVSTEGQAALGASLEAQEGKILAWGTSNGYEVKKTHVDAGLSGGRADNRPALQMALQEVKKGEALVVYSLSRLARSTIDAITISRELERKGADLVSLTERLDTTTASGKLLFKICAVFAEFEKDVISERTKMAMGMRRQQGRCVGTVPFGYDFVPHDKSLVENVREQRALKTIAELYKQGLSLREIGAELQKRRIMPKTSTHWHPQVIKSILKRQKALKP